ncbi:hypothetical protein ACWCXB_09215 [Streptomyces sp. NPDC001514]
MTDQHPAPDPAEDVRLAVYDAFARTGRPADTAALAAATGRSPAEVRQALRALHEHRDLVLDDPQTPGGERVVMAHPFAAVTLGFSVVTPPPRERGGFSLCRLGVATGQPGP